MISIIAAVGKNLELGKDNDLIWHLKEDLKNFKNMTLNKKIIMGTNTYHSLPGVLKNREYILLSRSLKQIKGVTIYSDFSKLLKDFELIDEEVFVIGGAMIYKLFLPYAKRLYLTEIHMNAEADTYFPQFNSKNYTRKVLNKFAENGIHYEIVLYEKRSI